MLQAGVTAQKEKHTANDGDDVDNGNDNIIDNGDGNSINLI